MLYVILHLNICINSQREIKHKLEGTRGGFSERSVKQELRRKK